MGLKQFRNCLLMVVGLASLWFASPAAFGARDHVVFADDARIEAGEKLDRVVLLGGELDFRGECEELVVIGGRAWLRKGSRVNGQLVLLGGNLQQEEGAFLPADKVVFQAPKDFSRFWRWAGPGARWLDLGWSGLLSFLFDIAWTFFLGLFLHLAAPRFSRELADRVKTAPAKNLGMGVLAAVGFVPGLVVLAISIVGILLIPFYLLLFVAIFCLGRIAAFALIGSWVPLKPGKWNHPLVRLGCGFALLSLIRMAPLGWLAVFIFTWLGCGAAARVLYARIRR